MTKKVREMSSVMFFLIFYSFRRTNDWNLYYVSKGPFQTIQDVLLKTFTPPVLTQTEFLVRGNYVLKNVFQRGDFIYFSLCSL